MKGFLTFGHYDTKVMVLKNKALFSQTGCKANWLLQAVLVCRFQDPPEQLTPLILVSVHLGSWQAAAILPLFGRYRFVT